MGARARRLADEFDASRLYRVIVKEGVRPNYIKSEPAGQIILSD